MNKDYSVEDYLAELEADEKKTGFSVYQGNQYQIPQECHYPNKKDISNIEDLKDANRFDMVFGLMKNTYRKSENFISGNVLYGDIDGGCSIEDFKNTFKDTEYFFSTSKSHLKAKGNEEPCERFHVFFPLGKEYSGDEIDKMLKRLLAKYPFFDQACKDTGRHFSGNKDAICFHNKGEIIKLEYEDNSKKAMPGKEYVNKFSYKAQVGERHGTLISLAGTYKNKGLCYDETFSLLMTKNNTFDEPKPYDEIIDICDYVYNRKIDVSTAEKFKSIGEVLSFFDAKYVFCHEGTKSVIYDRTTGRVLFANPKDFIFTNKRYEYFSIDARNGKPVEKMLPAPAVWIDNTVYYNGANYRPDIMPLTAYKEDGKDYFNVFNGFPYKAKETGKAKPFLDFMKEVICDNNETVYSYLSKWIANIIQNPTKKEGTAVAMGGEQGTGKGFFATTIGRMLGHNYVELKDAEPITGGYNGMIANKLLCFADEAFWSGDHKAMNALKGLISSDTFTFKEKYISEKSMNNFIRVITATNDSWIAPTQRKDRRWFVLSVSSAYGNNRQYFSNLWALHTQEGFFEDLFYHFSNIDIGDFMNEIPPMTQAKIEAIQEEMSNESVISFYLDLANNEEVFFDANGYEIFAKMLYKKYSEFFTSNYNENKKYKHSLEKFSIETRRIFKGIQTRRKETNEGKYTVFNFNNMKYIHSVLEAYTGIEQNMDN